MNALIGMYMPAESDQNVATLERWLGQRFDLHHVFTNWDTTDAAIQTLFEDTLQSIHAAGRTPLLTWEPFTPTSVETSPEVVRQIERGDYDEYLERWGASLARWLEGENGRSRRLVLRLAHEMNGSWYPWGVSNDAISAEAYVGMWRRVVDRVEAAGVDETRLDWVWCVNHVDVGGSRAEAYYPGDAYVDWVAVDGYNWGAAADWSTWQAPHEVFDNMVGRLRRLASKPIGITEFGSTSMTDEGVDPDRKSEWLEDAFDYFDDRGLEMVIGFNIDKETDWAVFGGEHGTATVTLDGRSYNVYPAFADGVARYADRVSR